MGVKSKFKLRLKTDSRGSETSISSAEDINSNKTGVVIIDDSGQEYELNVKGVWVKIKGADNDNDDLRQAVRRLKINALLGL